MYIGTKIVGVIAWKQRDNGASFDTRLDQCSWQDRVMLASCGGQGVDSNIPIIYYIRTDDRTFQCVLGIYSYVLLL